MRTENTQEGIETFQLTYILARLLRSTGFISDLHELQSLYCSTHSIMTLQVTYCPLNSELSRSWTFLEPTKQEKAYSSRLSIPGYILGTLFLNLHSSCSQSYKHFLFTTWCCSTLIHSFPCAHFVYKVFA